MVVKNKTEQIAEEFSKTPDQAWQNFEKLTTWLEREDVALKLSSDKKAYENFLKLYRQKVEPFIRESFYDIYFNNDRMKILAQQYEVEGNVEIPFLKDEKLAEISDWAVENLEPNGKFRKQPRYTYPPGEAVTFPDGDPRKQIMSEVNMTACSASLMKTDDIMMWVYHSPHLMEFTRKIMKFNAIYPYNECEIGLAINISRPVSPLKTYNGKKPELSLAFHFDSINSSPYSKDSTAIIQARGATGVIGIKDCKLGGERIVFPTVNREEVNTVQNIVSNFSSDADTIDTPFDGHRPKVVREPVAGVLCLFNGGNQLHAVASVKEGLRVIAAFLYCEENPDIAKDGNKNVMNNSVNAFYN